MPDLSINLTGNYNPEGVVSAVTQAYATSSSGAFSVNFSDNGTALTDVVEESGDPIDLSEGAIGELFLAGSDANEDDGLIWKTVLRTGTWQFRPGPGQQPIKHPLKVVLSNAAKGEVALTDVLRAFDEKAVEHVTVPLSHADRVDENTGFVRKMKVVEDGDLHLLRAGIEFTEPDVRSKVLNGSIANTSVGLRFDYIRKEDGAQYPVAMIHSALTNHPWINGMEPFGGQLAASEDEETPKIAGFELAEEIDDEEIVDEQPGEEGETLDASESEESTGSVEPPAVVAAAALPRRQPRTSRELLREAQRRRELRLSDNHVKEDNMSSNLTQLVEGLELSEEQKAIVDQHETELARLRADARKREVTDKVEELKSMGFSEFPGLLKTIREVLLSDDGGTALLLSEEAADGTKSESNLTATDIVNKLVTALPMKDGKLDFSDQATGLVEDEKPPVTEGETKTDEERAAEARAFLGLK